MPFPRRLLYDDEEVALDLRPHWWYFSRHILTGIPLLAIVVGVASIQNDDVRNVVKWPVAALVLGLLLRVEPADATERRLALVVTNSAYAPALPTLANTHEDGRARDSGRAKLAMALRRGTLARGCCRECGARAVVGLIADPARWRAVVWVCREHRQGELERRRDAAAQHAADAKQAAWYNERARGLAAIELLPPAERAQLHALAGRGPAGTQLSPGAPLYVMNLVRVFKTRS